MNNRLREALSEMIYETTHLSPEQEDGSHWCKISKTTLTQARKALQEDTMNQETFIGLMQLLGCTLIIIGVAVLWGGGAGMIAIGCFLLFLTSTMQNRGGHHG